MLLCCLAFEHPYLAEQLAGELRFPNLKNGSDFRRPLPYPTRRLTAPANLTVEGWLTRWLEGIRGEVSRATYDGYKRDVRHHIIPELGRRRLKDLSPGDIRRLYRTMIEKGLKNRSVEYCHRTLRKALKAAVTARLLNHNPTDGVKPLTTREGVRAESKALNHEQVSALLEEASGDRLEALYVVALHTGLRRGELLGLRWTDID